MWVRFTFPRFREDQLQRFAWKVLIPISLANIAITAVSRWPVMTDPLERRDGVGRRERARPAPKGR